ncbi:MAG: reverse transcriptase domain-containing protein [Candidatus Thiodiazotropha endolucinida]|nr:hypothetical protein [Candidatus Thiodiazotropha taylori]MCW4344028.1 reverse transcriptase domain-containing protein [Candidatus Thiodiazotropha endolucinida]
MCGDVEANPGPNSAYYSISILHLNIRSIRRKFEFIKENLLDYDILCFTESHLNEDVLTESLLLDNFSTPFRKDRNNRGGGILVYINNKIFCERKTELEIFWDECIWLKINQKRVSFLLGVFYSPKTSDLNFFNKFNDNIELAQQNTNNLIIVGDLNDDLLNDRNYLLKDVLLLNSLENIITDPTRGIALLDPVILPFDQQVLDSGTLSIPEAISDHSATYLTVPFEYPLSTSYKRTVWLYKKGNYELLSDKINTHEWNYLNYLEVNDATKQFETDLTNFAKQTIPTQEITVRKDDKPWYDSEVRKHSRIRDRMKSKAEKSNNPVHWQKYKSVRNKVNNLKRHAKEKFYSNLETTLIESSSNNRREFWKIVRHFVKSNQSSTSIPPLITQENGQRQIHSTDHEKAECLNSYFTSISTVPDTIPDLPPFQPKSNATLETFEISEQEVYDILSSLNANKASGPNFISYRLLKSFARAVTKPLTILFNRLINDGIFPDPWKFSYVIPIPKKGDASDPSNNRPIALLNPLGKVMERVIFKHLYNYLYSNGLIYNRQSGFIPGHSTTLQLIDIYHSICNIFDNNQFSCMVFCDISKAFDRVWHEGLIFKLKQYGISDQLLSFLENYLSNRKQSVLLNDVISPSLSVTAGVPQGSVLGPLLFLIYINDISENLLSLTRLFADDSSLFVSATNMGDLEGILNHDLLIITHWAKQWLIKFNPNKTEAMLFSYTPREYFPNIVFDGVSVKFVNEHKHLGITFSDNMKWNKHIESILSPASRIIGIMRKLKYDFSRTALNQIYVSYVRPLLEYSSIVWDGCTVEQSSSLEKLQNEAARIVTGLTRSVSLERLYTECGWESLQSRRTNQKLKFMYRAVNGTVPSYISELIPPTVSEVSRYNLRDSSNITVPFTRTATFKRSCIPSSIALWNNLDPSTRMKPTLSSFNYALRFHAIPKVPLYFIQGNRKLSVLHARLRNHCSNLNLDLHNNHIRDNPLCDCLRNVESAEHFFFECARFTAQRIVLFNSTRQFHPLNIGILLNGNEDLTLESNFSIFTSVQKFIKDSARFE